MAANATSVIEFEAASNGDIVVRNGTAGKKLFKFDRVFSPQDDQCKQAQLQAGPRWRTERGVVVGAC